MTTNKELISKAERYAKNRSDGYYDYLANGGKECDEAIEEIESCEKIIDALKKQIPTSMDLEGDGYADGVMIYDTWICPRCGKHYELEYDYYDFCPNCGQALDWED